MAVEGGSRAFSDGATGLHLEDELAWEAGIRRVSEAMRGSRDWPTSGETSVASEWLGVGDDFRNWLIRAA
jgi:hypothetical protein